LVTFYVFFLLLHSTDKVSLIVSFTDFLISVIAFCCCLFILSITDFSKQKNALSFARRIFDDNGKPLGMVCLDILLDKIRELVINYKHEASVMFARQIKNGWFIAVVIPENAYFSQMKRMRLMKLKKTIPNNFDRIKFSKT